MYKYYITPDFFSCSYIRIAIYVIRVITNAKGLTEITATATTQAVNIVPDKVLT